MVDGDPLVRGKQRGHGVRKTMLDCEMEGGLAAAVVGLAGCDPRAVEEYLENVLSSTDHG